MGDWQDSVKRRGPQIGLSLWLGLCLWMGWGLSTIYQRVERNYVQISENHTRIEINSQRLIEMEEHIRTQTHLLQEILQRCPQFPPGNAPGAP